jgi:hypothetical protein
MSFTKDARRVRNFRIPLKLRRDALTRCIVHLVLFSGLRRTARTREAFQVELREMNQLGQRFFLRFAKQVPTFTFDLDRIQEFTEEELLDALRLVEAEWNRFLVRKRAFDQKRIRQKVRGIRQVRRADRDVLYNRKRETDGTPGTT